MSINSSIQRHIERYGQLVTVTEMTKTGEDSYGDPIYDETDTEIEARVDVGGNDETVQAGGSEVDVDADIFVSSDTGLSFNTVEAENPTEIDVDGDIYKILYPDDQDNGLVRLACKRE